MKFVIVFTALFAVALAAPVEPQAAETLRYDNNNIGVDGYSWAVETSDGKTANEEGQLKNVGSEDEALSVRGAFSYIGDDGIHYSVTYVADEFGFRPSGEHLPVVPGSKVLAH